MEQDNKKNETEQDTFTHTYDNGFHPKEVHLKQNYKLYRKGFFFKIGHVLTALLVKFFFWFPKTFVWNLKIVGKENVKELNGATLVSNHTHQLDALMYLSRWPFKLTYVTMLESNLGFGIVSKFFRLGGAVPIPTDQRLFIKFVKETIKTVDEGHPVLIYPEAALVPYSDHIRPFKDGAFRFAFQTKNKKIVPMCLTYHKPKGIYKLTRRKKPCIKINILKPYYIKDLGNKKKSIELAEKEVHEILSEYFNTHSDYFFKDENNK